MHKNLKIKTSFYDKVDNDDVVSVTINISSNHEVKNDIMSKVEKYIGELFQDAYIDMEQYQHKKEQQKLAEQSKKQNEKYQKQLLKAKTAKEKKECKPAKNKYDL